MNSVTLDCDNFDPQPTYPGSSNGEDDEGSTTFEVECADEFEVTPKEYTCNFDNPVPFVRDPAATPVSAPGTVCGTPAAGT